VERRGVVEAHTFFLEVKLDTTLGIAVIIATLAGPILAVIITRIGDRRRSQRERQMDIFRSLWVRVFASHAAFDGESQSA
jgi:hypothetical protein